VNAHRARKRFGQNFLTDVSVIHRIIDLIAPSEGEHIVEIGPGRLALTEPLAARATRLSVVEIDRDLGANVVARFRDEAHVDVVIGDALKTDFAALGGGQPLRIAGNLPYNISTPLILHLLTSAGTIRDMTFMLQKEVVDRLAARSGTRDYGRLTVMVQSQCDVDACFEVPPEAFDPVPRVMSKLVRITPHRDRHPGATPALEACVRIAFSQRRKTLRNTLGKHYPHALLEDCGINLSERPGDLAVDDYIRLADALSRR